MRPDHGNEGKGEKMKGRNVLGGMSSVRRERRGGNEA